MEKTGKNYEILAPAGSTEQLMAAVHNGCDSVYLGLESFNARLKAPNFSVENVGHWIDFCHFFGVKVYVTVNTSVKNSEYIAAKKAIYVAYQNGADGVIVTDLSLMQYAATLPKPFDVVASTQLNIHDAYGAQMVKSLGATTVVCARECSLADIKSIASVGLTVECFLHGALCVCQSGQCLFSSMVGGNSGNRGLCAQPCRKLYKANDGKFVAGGYLLSTSDICSLDTARQLLDCGATVFKIEGRNRRAEYAGVTSAVYSGLFERNFAVEQDDRLLLAEMYNRGNLPACRYLTGSNDGIVYPYAQNHIGRKVGVVKNGKVLCDVALQKGDGLKVFDGSREVCGGVVVTGGDVAECEFSGAVSDGMTVCRTSSVQLSKDVLGKRRTLQVCAKFVAKVGERANLTVKCGDACVTVQSDYLVPQAVNQPVDSAVLCEQLQKTGDSCYTITDIVSEIDDVFLAKSQINALRRLALDKLTTEIIAQYNSKFAARRAALFEEAEKLPQINKPNCLAVVCENAQQVLESGAADYIIYKPQILNEESVAQLGDKFCFLDIPSFADLDYMRQLISGKNIGLVCHNIGHVQLARALGLPYIAGSGLNVFNDYMAAVFSDAATFFYSQELTLAEISKFRNCGGIVYVDGPLALMKLVHCPFKFNFGTGCDNCQAHRPLVYTDELGNSFCVTRRKDALCTFELVNGKKLSVLGRLQRGGRYCVHFDKLVVDHYLKLNGGIDDGLRETQPYTKGRLYNKIN